MKPTVHYRPHPDQLIQLNQRALILPLDHPATDRVSNTTWVTTSRVVAMTGNGRFETLNTQYVPAVQQ